MAHSFKISVTDDLPSTLAEVKKTIVEGGGEFKGDANKGKFSGKTILGKIKGEYSCLSDDKVKITITKKPFATSKGKIESAIRKFFEPEITTSE